MSTFALNVCAFGGVSISKSSIRKVFLIFLLEVLKFGHSLHFFYFKKNPFLALKLPPLGSAFLALCVTLEDNWSHTFAHLSFPASENYPSGSQPLETPLLCKVQLLALGS